MAAEQALAGRLAIGASQAASEQLLQETREALDAQLRVVGVFDLRPALAAAAAGGVLNARQLEGVAASLEAAFAVRVQACQPAAGPAALAAPAAPTGGGSGSGGAGTPGKRRQPPPPAAATGAPPVQAGGAGGGAPRYPLLARLARGIEDTELATLRAIRACISGGGIVDEASQQLAAVRKARRDNLAATRQLVTAWSRQLASKGASDTREPSLMRGRLCVSVRANMRSLLPKGSMRLGASSTGATVYVEPADAVPLNNREAELQGREADAELAVLTALSGLLAGRAAALMGLLASVTALDVVSARAQHAEWLGGVRPRFVSRYSVDPAYPICVPGARHPLLLERALPPLARPPSGDDNAFEADFMPAPSWAALAPGGNGDSGRQAQPPRALDLQVPPSCSVVAITGPNTGGKTVALKTTGLMVLMSKAGLFLPVDPETLDDSGDAYGAAGQPQRLQQPGGQQAAGPSLYWFDSVLADIGDSQSLQQNLSTFSGHVRRLQRVLTTARQLSLVLLDEVGSGTDPQEGAALARAVLDRLAGQAGLTLATTHHAELKEAADEDPRYTNVSMEFDTSTLQPTYRMLWGCAGASNAIDIAQSLGFDRQVLADARKLAAGAAAEAAAAAAGGGRMAEVAANVELQLGELRRRLAALQAARQRNEAGLLQLRQVLTELVRVRRRFKRVPHAIEVEVARFALELQQGLLQVRRGQLAPDQLQQQVVDRWAHVLPQDKLEALHGGGAGAGRAAPAGGIVAGDLVQIKRLGSLGFGTVDKVVGDTVSVSVMAGVMMTTVKRVKLSEVVKVEGSYGGDAPPGPGLAGLLGEAQGEAYAALMDRVEEALQGAAGAAAAGDGGGDSGAGAANGVSASASAEAGGAAGGNGGAALLRRQRGQAAPGQVLGGPPPPQCAGNTLDVEGMLAEAACEDLVAAIEAHEAAGGAAAAARAAADAAGPGGPGVGGALQGGALYLQHGVGTGALKQALLRRLEACKDAGRVVRFEAAGADGGLTLVILP